MEAANLMTTLQAALGPCVLISGLGLLLLVMTNRIGRPIDRIRSLYHELEHASGSQAPSLHKQIKILYQRCQLLQFAIAFITFSIFLVSLIIFILFAMFTFDINLITWVRSLFLFSILSIIISLLFFLMDISFTLNSIKIEIKGKESR